MIIKPEETAAVIIDYQEKLLPVMHEKEELMKRSLILLQGLKTLEIPMYKTQQYTKGLGMTVPEINEASGIPAEEYFDKTRFSGYEAIKDSVKGKKYILICGIEAHICVLQTIIELKENGYIPVLITDCISSRNKRDKKMAIKRAMQEGALISGSESILFELLGQAGGDKFKTISKLIK